ncbi:cation:proton antiporter domain-containing protein [Aeoliella sp. SH292]|uniref:cation:proton antiporter domain-containing protein n=1 Tax=Aeoliella sp. SH292 TaxID=3454464 RepID=UPI003F9AFB45
MKGLAPTELGVMLLSLALLIGVARALGELARRFRQPAILGELLAGVLLGPTLFGYFAPELQGFLFPQEGPNAVVLDGIASLAIVLFLLVAGMEVDLSIVWKQGFAALKVGVLGTIIPFVIGVACAYLMPQAMGRQTDADPLVFALFVGTAIAISALPVIAKTLMDLDLYRTDFGMVVVSAAIFNDLVGWTIFAIILGMMGTHSAGIGIGTTLILTIAFAIFVLTIGRMAMHRCLPFLQAYTHYPGGVLGFAVTMGLLGAAFTEFAGIHAIFGAFLVGVALGDSSHLSERTRVMIDEFVSFIFAPLFFASIGLKVNFVTHFDLPLVLMVLLVATVGKLFGAVLGARWGGFPTRERWAIGFAMNARGAMEIILGTLALEAGIIRQRLFVALVIMAIVTSAVGGPLIRRVLSRRQSQRLMPLLSAKTYLPNLIAETRWDAICELARVAADQAGLSAETIIELAWEREQLAATGIGHGVAIPHARLAELKAPVVVMGVSEAGISFDAPDGQPAHVILLLVTPSEEPTIQLELSADIANMFRDPQCLERIQRASNYTQLMAALKAAAASKQE